MPWIKGISIIPEKKLILINMEVVHIHGSLDKGFGNVGDHYKIARCR